MNKIDPQKAARNLKNARKHAGLSISQVVDLTGITRQQIILYESLGYDHRVYFPREHVNMLAAVYAVSAQYLRGGEAVDIHDMLANGMTEDELIAWVREQQEQEANDGA